VHVAQRLPQGQEGRVRLVRRHRRARAGGAPRASAAVELRGLDGGAQVEPLVRQRHQRLGELPQAAGVVEEVEALHARRKVAGRHRGRHAQGDHKARRRRRPEHRRDEAQEPERRARVALGDHVMALLRVFVGPLAIGLTAIAVA
jgi:hypothetical protein